MPSDPVLFDRALSSLGVTPGLRLETQWPGVFGTTTSTDDGQRALHVLNTSGAPATVTVGIDGTPIAAGTTLHVPPRPGHILPLGLDVAGRRQDWASAEIAGADADGTVHFRPGLDEDCGTNSHRRRPPSRTGPTAALAPSLSSSTYRAARRVTKESHPGRSAAENESSSTSAERIKKHAGNGAHPAQNAVPQASSSSLPSKRVVGFGRPSELSSQGALPQIDPLIARIED